MVGTDRHSFRGIIGRSAGMQALFRQIGEFAPSNLPVVIRGEAGTGKELVASAVQHLSRRRARGYQPVNCPDFTPDLLRSELFGHERGAFTGAVAKKEGLLPRVDGGMVFLDEIGELAPIAQSMLLRFLQTGEGLAVGATHSMRLDVRVIAATHRNLEAAVLGGTFREDFYYRLWGAVLRVPPLRTRPEDIPLLVEHFRLKFNSDDQLKSVVVLPCRYEPGLQRTYEDFAEHYGTAILPARPAKPRDKAKIEAGVLVAERWILARLRNETFFSLAALNTRIAELLTDLNTRLMRLVPREPPGALRAPRSARAAAAAGRALRLRRVERGPRQHRLPRRAPPPLLLRAL